MKTFHGGRKVEELLISKIVERRSANFRSQAIIRSLGRLLRTFAASPSRSLLSQRVHLVRSLAAPGAALPLE